MLTGLWLVGTVLATVVVWLGVRVVDREVTALPPTLAAASPSTSTPVSAGPSTSTTSSTTVVSTEATGSSTTAVVGATPTTRRPSSPSAPATPTTTTTTAPAAPPPTTAPPPSAPTNRTFNGQGGSVTIRFTDTTVELVVATPESGYAVEVDDGGPDRVRVEFSGDDHVTRIEARAGDESARVSEQGRR